MSDLSYLDHLERLLHRAEGDSRLLGIPHAMRDRFADARVAVDHLRKAVK